MQLMVMVFKFLISLHMLLSLLQSNFLCCPLNMLELSLYSLLWRKILLLIYQELISTTVQFPVFVIVYIMH